MMYSPSQMLNIHCKHRWWYLRIQLIHVTRYPLKTQSWRQRNLRMSGMFFVNTIRFFKWPDCIFLFTLSEFLKNGLYINETRGFRRFSFLLLCFLLFFHGEIEVGYFHCVLFYPSSWTFQKYEFCWFILIVVMLHHLLGNKNWNFGLKKDLF